MPLSKQHKAATRERIVASAGRLFRRQGFEPTSLGAVMADAGLTHGGFYAHFASKQDLLREVLTHDHGFIRLLARRRPGALADWRLQTAQVFADYLEPAHLAEVADGCSFAALTGDAARAEPAVREGYRAAWERLVGEVLRGPRQTAWAAHQAASAVQRERAAALVGMAIGAVALARVLAPHPAAAALLCGTAAQVAQALAAWPVTLRARPAGGAAAAAPRAGAARRASRRR